MKKIISICFLCFYISLWATTKPLYDFQNTSQRQQFQQLTETLRCLVCQNESLADSQAPLAADLREQVFTQIQQGKSNQEITNYLVERYGQFIQYNPPLQSSTLILWLAPLGALIIGFMILFMTTRNRYK